MAEVANGCRERLEGGEATTRSPRCEAFLMTGEKILNLNPNVSPSYAKMCGAQLPPTTAVAEESPRRRGPFDDFPSLHHKTSHFRPKMASSSSQPDSVVEQSVTSAYQSSVTVNAVQAADDRVSITRSPLAVPKPVAEVEGDDERMVRELLEEMGEEEMMMSPAPPVPMHLDRAQQASDLARRLFELDGFKKSDVANYLNQTDEFSLAVFDNYLSYFHWGGLRLDAALRDFLGRVQLRGETSERERLLQGFAGRYYLCNPLLFKTVDDVHVLTCALLLLNSDLHGENCGRRMSVRDFVDNLAHTNSAYPRALLKTFYSSIKSSPINYHDDEPPSSSVSKDANIKRRSTFKTKKSDTVDMENQVEYKHGWLVRKCVYDSDGKRTPYGRRGWRMLHARLRGLVLFLARDEEETKRSRYETLSNSILLHHAIAEEATDYKKKPHVFRIRTANLGEFLFQTSDAKELADWISSLNFVIASFSSRALPAPVGSSAAFCRPLLPSTPSNLPLPAQLKAHEGKVTELKERLSQLQEEAPPITARGRTVQEYFFRERYLLQEIRRYEAYVRVLEKRLGELGGRLGDLEPKRRAQLTGVSEGDSDSTSGVHSVVVDEDKVSYREAMGSRTPQTSHRVVASPHCS